MLHSEVEFASLARVREEVGRARRMRILFVITALQTGGAEMMLCRLLARMDRSRFDPSVICLGGSGTPGARIEALGIPLHVANMSPTPPPLRSLWRVCKWVRDLPPDLIQGWMYHGNAVASLAQFLSVRSVPVLWSVRHTAYRLRDERPGTANLIRLSALVSRRPLRIIYASRASADQHEALGFAADRTAVIPNGFDCERLKPSRHTRTVLRNQLNAGEDALLIGLISRFHPMKDHASFLEAAGVISETNQSVQFVLAGPGIEWNNPVLVDLVNRFRLNGRVHLLGERDDIPELTAALDIAASSSFSESFPNVVGEAMACGVPCVVTDVGDSAAIVGGTGLVVPPRDPAALAAACSRLIHVGTAERAKLGAAARQRILDYFSLDRVVRQYETLYDEVLQIGLSKNSGRTNE